MDLASFTESLRRLSAHDIRHCAARLQRDEQCVADQVSQWRAELAIDRLIRRQCTRAEAQRASATANRTARLVVEVAEGTGILLPDGDVTHVARTAAQIACGLALQGHGDPSVEYLLSRFRRALEGATSPLVGAA